jgi:hypothetical protein
MIVSKDLGFFTLKPRNSRKERMIAPQRQVGQIDNDFGSSSDDEPFSTHPAKAGLPYCPSARSFARRNPDKAANRPRPEGKYSNVPLKSLQEFSHVEGASLFNAPTPAFMRRLPIAEDKPREVFITKFTEDFDIPYDHPLAYELGIRPAVRNLPAQRLIAEPTRNLYRSNVAPVPPETSRKKVKSVDYDIGDDELREMMRHTY